jgi:hypothetical protein
MRRLFSKSRRQRLIYIILFVWIAFGIMAFIKGTDFMGLAAYFAAFASPAIMYLWVETKRKSLVDTMVKTILPTDCLPSLEELELDR